jgi:hypothetical protein
MYTICMLLLVWPLSHTYCRCRGLLLRLITLFDTYTLCRAPLDEGSACRRGLYLYNTQNSQETDIHASSGIRTRNPSKRAAADLRLRPRDHRHQLVEYFPFAYVDFKLDSFLSIAAFSFYNCGIWKQKEIYTLSYPLYLHIYSRKVGCEYNIVSTLVSRVVCSFLQEERFIWNGLLNSVLSTGVQFAEKSLEEYK